MKTKTFLFVVALLVASTSLKAESADVVVDESISIRQTEELVKLLNLNKRQAKKILTINQKYLLKNTLLDAQRDELERLGYLSESVMDIYHETVSKFENDKKDALKTVVKDEQWIAYENSVADNN
jgi:hypothetical protein